MPIPLAVGRLNRVGFNRLSRPFAAHLPGFGVVQEFLALDALDGAGPVRA